MNKIYRGKNQNGQSIVVLLFFVMVAMMVATAASYIIGANSLSSSRHELGEEARILAETGAENALLKLLRDPNYIGETMEIDGNPITLNVAGSTLKTVTSTAQASGSIKTIEVIVNYDNNVLAPVSWMEVN